MTAAVDMAAIIEAEFATWVPLSDAQILEAARILLSSPERAA